MAKRSKAAVVHDALSITPEGSETTRAKISQEIKDIWDQEVLMQAMPVLKFEQFTKDLDLPERQLRRPSNWTPEPPRIMEPCIMCGEELGFADTLPYHIPHGRYAMNYPETSEGKDCTPSCMWCAQVFGSKEELEAHEAECR